MFSISHNFSYKDISTAVFHYIVFHYLLSAATNTSDSLSTTKHTFISADTDKCLQTKNNTLKETR